MPQSGNLHLVPYHYQNFTRFWLFEQAERMGAEVVTWKPLGGAWRTIASRLFLMFWPILGLHETQDPLLRRRPWHFWALLPFQVIVAIIGVETNYGRITGKYKVLDALVTLAFYYPPRAEFFRKELREFLLLAREEQVDPLSLKGSYAGAMGLPQFMPSSFRAYAVDFDGDGRINIWSNPTDAIGSVASYFKQHGWTAGGQVVSRAQVRGEQVDQGLTVGIEPVKTVGELRTLGWSSHDALRAEMPVTAFRFDGAEGPEYWLGLPNFYAITRYNRSAMYAMAVYQLSELLLQARGAE